MTREINKIIRPGSVPAFLPNGEEHRIPVYIRIKHYQKKSDTDKWVLSISGVISPLRNGDALGSVGQIVNTLRRPDFKPDRAAGWNIRMVKELADIWDEWHLNDMRPYTEKMRLAGWAELALKPIYEFRVRPSDRYWELREAAKKKAYRAAARNEKDDLTDDERLALCTSCVAIDRVFGYDPEHPPCLMHGLRPGVLDKLPDLDALKFFEIDRKHRPFAEKTILGHVYSSEHPDGLLGRAYPDDPEDPEGKGYGGAWWYRPVPPTVLDWLAGLPDSDIRPPWV